DLRVGSVFEETYFKGGSEPGADLLGTDGDHIRLNVDALSVGPNPQPFTSADVTPHVNVAALAPDADGFQRQALTLLDVTGGTFTLSFAGAATAPILWDAPAATVEKALEQLAGLDDVGVVKNGNVYTVTFLNVNGVAKPASVAPLTAGTAGLRSNGIHAVVTVNGEGGDDSYTVNLIGHGTDSLINVFDSGTSDFTTPAATDADTLTVNGTDNPDVFLLRAATADDGLAFVALINAPQPHAVAAGDPVERVNYTRNLETITAEGRAGNDEFYIDDTRAIITINGGAGEDFFQVGQLYQSRRTPELAGVLPEDVFATIETTRGWLSAGISEPMTINGGDDNDNFIVFHNLAVLNLNGNDGDDSFLIQAFALAGSQEDHRALTDLSGDAGADLIQYAVNAPVNINGGDGFDKVIEIGTEFGDDFVITRGGVFGAGLNVNFVNIEQLEVDGAEGDDR